MDVSRQSEATSESANNQLLLVSLLQPERVPEEVLLKRHPAIIKGLKALLLVVPSPPCYLEVWPPGLESHDIAFNSLFNRTANSASGQWLLLLRTAAVISTADCPYLQAYSVVAAAKAGVPEAKIIAAATRTKDVFSAQEIQMMEAVDALCAQPQPTFTKHQKTQLEATFGAKRAEWFAGATAAFGYLAKFMDAVVTEMEQPIADIANGALGKYGWTPGAHGWMLDPTSEPTSLPKPDSFGTRMKNMRHLPGVIMYLSGLEKGVPNTWAKLEPFLKAHTGHNFPFIQHIRTPHMRKGFAALLVRNLNPDTSVSGLAVKCLIGMMYATFVGCPTTEAAVHDMSVKFGVSDADLAKVKEFALSDDVSCERFSNKQVSAMLVLGKAVLRTPCKVTPKVVDHIRDVDLGASVIVELVLWVSLLVALRRMAFYYLL